MKTFRVFIHPKISDGADSIIAVKEGFSFWALVFNIFWALWHRAWVLAAVFLAWNITKAMLIEKGFVNTTGASLMDVVVILYLAFEAADYYAESLKRRGFKEKGIVLAENADAARMEYLCSR